MALYINGLQQEGLTASQDTTLTTIEGLHDVPGISSADNVNLRDVVGNKDDAGGGSLMNYAKSTNAVLTVATADVATNTKMQHVVGNKDDTVAGTSIVALLKQIKVVVDLL